jgi:hypothetical protein
MATQAQTKQTQEALKELNARARVISNGSKVLTKTNGSQYILYNVQILEGPAKDKKFTAERVILNSKNEEKPSFQNGDEVQAYISVFPSTIEGRKYQMFVSLGELSSTSNTDDELGDLLLSEDI